MKVKTYSLVAALTALMLASGCSISTEKVSSPGPSTMQTSGSQEVSTTQASVSTLQIEGLTFTLPDGWSVAGNANGEASLNVPDPQYHVTIPMQVVKNPNHVTLADAQQSGLVETAPSGAEIYNNACAPSIACYYVVYNNTIYDVSFGEPNSDEPAPANLDGVWFPSTTVTAQDTLNFTATVQ